VLGVFDEVLDLGVMPVPVLNLRGCLGCGDIEVGQDERVPDFCHFADLEVRLWG
jgi:hypothetical protein